jgi:ribosomal protein L21E
MPKSEQPYKVGDRVRLVNVKGMFIDGRKSVYRRHIGSVGVVEGFAKRPRKWMTVNFEPHGKDSAVPFVVHAYNLRKED